MSDKLSKILTPETDRNSRLVNREEAAQILGTSPATLAVWACTKRYDLPYVKIGRLVKYRLSDIYTFIEQQSISNVEV